MFASWSLSPICLGAKTNTEREKERRGGKETDTKNKREREIERKTDKLAPSDFLLASCFLCELFLRSCLEFHVATSC